MNAPDFAEPFEAWRVWKVVRQEGHYSLGSVVQSTLWPAGEPLVAECLASRPLRWLRRREREHDAPAAECQCGIYAGAREWVEQYADADYSGRVAGVIGRVALWGAVIECERGFRASHAYPLRLYLPAGVGETWRTTWEEVALGLGRYRVPIEPADACAADLRAA